MTPGEPWPQRLVTSRRSAYVELELSITQRMYGTREIAGFNQIRAGTFANRQVIDVGSDYHRFNTFDDSGLLAGYFCQSGTEELLMIEPNAGDNGNFLMNDVGRIQTSA